MKTNILGSALPLAFAWGAVVLDIAHKGVFAGWF
jgi:hypothetical protein